MKSSPQKCIFLATFLFLSLYTYACKVSPSFSTGTSHTCGLPFIVNVSNTSSGTQAATASYYWQLNGAIVDSTKGLSSITLFLKQVGANTIELISKDSSGCLDTSSVSTITVTTNAARVLDQNAVYTYSPVWMNCIQFITSPDTFSIRFSASDTLQKLRILWGDGSMDTGKTNLPPNTVKSHLYTNLGIFPVKIVTQNGACTDTVYGMVYSQRQPTAGIIGPTSGSNRGCVPHKMRIVNNSYNISNNTTFDIDWGVGPVITLPYTSYKDTLYNIYKTGMCGGLIRITARNVCGNSIATWNPIDISDKDKALWTVNLTCDPTKPHVFHNVSKDRYCLLPDVKEYFWDFGDGTTVGWTSSKADQSHIFKTEGDYIITLITKNGCGYDTFKGKIPVYYNPVAGFRYNANRGCRPLSVTYTDTSKGRGYTRLWVVNEGSVTKTFTDSIFTYTFTKPGVHYVSLTVTNKCASSATGKNFTVNDKPTAGFSNLPGTCLPAKISFTNTSASYFNNPSYVWDFGDNTSSTLKNPPSKLYATAGNYTIRLVVIDSCGSDTFRQTFSAYGLPVALLNGDTAGCTFDSLSFNNQSLKASSYDWNFGDNIAAISNSTGLTKHAYLIPGNFTVRLIAITNPGCRDTAYHNLRIKPGAKALFDFSKPYGCSPAKFKFTNNSFYGKDFRWYANSKLISTNKNISDSIINTDSTVVRLKLIATSASSCQGDSIEKIYFTPKNPKAIIVNKDSGCGILKVTFNNSSNYGYTYNWNLGNGTTSVLKNPLANYVAAKKADTLYNVKLNVANWAGCKDSANATVKVFPSPAANFISDKVNGCGPLNVGFTNQSLTNNGNSVNTLSYLWRFNNGSTSSTKNPNTSFGASKVMDTFYKVSLRTTSLHGCFDSIVKTIQVYPLPYIKFTADKLSGCQILTVNFTNKSNPRDTGNIGMMNFNWSSGNGKSGTARDFKNDFGASLSGDTIYKVKLVGYSEHGCVDSNTLDIAVHPDPKAIFNLNTLSGCTPLKVSTKNLSLSFDGGPLYHQWKFGNGYTSYDKDDSVVYTNNTGKDSVWKVWYEAISQYGCRDTSSINIIVHPKPSAKFNVSAKKACAPLNLKVTDASANAFAYFWGRDHQLSKGAVSELVHLPGLRLFDTIYTIGHQVASAYGCLSDTVYQDIIVMGRPVADFEYSKDSFCSQDLVTISNNTMGGSKFLWKFSDNTTSNSINPKHKFPINTGNGRDSLFKVILEASTATGCRDTAVRTIYIVNHPLEKIILDKNAGCTNLKVNMMQKSKLFKTLYWDFGDNTTYGTSDSVTHTYINPLDNLTMQPKVVLYRERFNCRDTVSVPVAVYPKPMADFKAFRYDPCDAGLFSFVNLSKNNNTNMWSLDNSLTYSVSNLSIILASSNLRDTSYSIKLFVKNTYQCTDSAVQSIKVKQNQVIQFITGPLIGCENGKINFTNQSTGTVRSFWTFGDGGMSNEPSPSYIYNKYGDYKAMLYGYDKDGCVDSSDGKTIVKVLERPKADFTYLPVAPRLPNAQVDFTATPIINTVNVNALIYDWDFGDKSYPSSNKNQQKPSHVYTTAGKVYVKLTVMNQQCADSIIQPLTVEDMKPNINFTPDTLQGCIPLKVKFKNQTTSVLTYRWVFGDGSPDSYDKEPVHIFELPGSWDVTLIATGLGGTATKTYKYLINTYPKPFVDFYATPREMHLPNAVFYMKNNSNTVKDQWFVYDSIGILNGYSELHEPSFTLGTFSTFSMKLIGTNSFGCVDSMIKPGYIRTLIPGYVYVPNAFSPNGNSKNDGFQPSLMNIKSEQYMFRIYNRWGEKLFETTERDALWNGTFNGVNCQQDTYIWTLSGLYDSGDNFSLRGTVTLLR